ncbi:unnamed protein product [Urochloa decumbens]|uniref:Late embryogenesis abundant protein LEA-2 subgroup domain-containing protein n=1 Tax=Urochloa decumbens TaxID=240449 RepID=A0ABC8VHH5_9POAL
MGAYPKEDQPVLPRHGGLSRQRRQCLCCWFVLLAIFVSLVILTWYGDQSTIPPDYSIAITAVSGLDPATDLQKGPLGLLSPAFNLTVGVASRSRVYGACIGPHTAVKVSCSYLLLPLASGSAPAICVGPLESSGPRPVAARGRDVAVPGFLVDTLAEEMRSGEAMFQVKLIEGGGGGWRDVETRWVRVEASAASV